MAVVPQLKLSYFDIVALGELPRLVFVYGKIPFEDKRIAHSEWLALKPTTPMGKLPTLEVDGVTYSESMAIARYAAKLSGLYPQDLKQSLRVEMISDTLRDVLDKFVDIHFHEKDEAVKGQMFAKLTIETIPPKFAALEAMVQGDYFMGDQVTFADIQLFDLIHNSLRTRVPGFTSAPFPKLQAIVNRIKVNPDIAAYLAKHAK